MAASRSSACPRRPRPPNRRAQRAAYHLIRLERQGGVWRISARARGLMPNGGEIGERDAIEI